MMSERLKPEANWRMIEPGVYVDSNGKAHVFAEEMLAAMGLPETDDNRRIVLEECFAMLAELCPDAECTVRVMQDGKECDA